MLFVTTLPAPITQLSPIVTLGSTQTCATYPHVIAHSDRTCIFQSTVTLLDIKGMSCRVETTIGSYEDIVAKSHFSFVKDDTVNIGIEVLS